MNDGFFSGKTEEMEFIPTQNNEKMRKSIK